MLDILHYDLLDFVTSYGVRIPSLRVTYQLFGKPLGTAPVVVVNHAFTGNSQVAGENGWWAEAIGTAKVINTDIYTVVAFNIPGNGFHAREEDMITNYQHWAAVDVARLFNIALKEHLGLNSVFALVGCSLGGGIAWVLLHVDQALQTNNKFGLAFCAFSLCAGAFIALLSQVSPGNSQETIN